MIGVEKKGNKFEKTVQKAQKQKMFFQKTERRRKYSSKTRKTETKYEEILNKCYADGKSCTSSGK